MAEPPQFSVVDFPPPVSEPMDCNLPLGVTAQCIVLRHFREMLEQREPAWQAEDVEAVHKLRVAARRTRTALQTFAALWEGQPAAQRHLQSLAGFAEAFNVARDLDVMIIYLGDQLKSADEHRRPALTWLLARNQKLREKQRPRLHKTLRSFEQRQVAQRFVDFFSRNPVDLWPTENVGANGCAPASDTSNDMGAQPCAPTDAATVEDLDGPQ